VWLVAHPRQRPNWRGEAPSLSDIAGGANFWNKADNGIVVHRLWNRLSEMQDRGGQPGRVQPRSRSSTPTPSHPSSGGAAMEDVEVQIRVEKVRNKTTGCQGECALEYDRVTGRYQEPEPDQALLAQLPWHDHSTGTYA
jgi:twinkle protein